jgi:phosphoserine phosphatase
VKQLVVAFDVDDTLIVPAVATGFDRDVPNYETIAVYRWFQAQGHTMVIWSGGGAQYARDWADKLGLVASFYLDKHSRQTPDGDYCILDPDLTFDDSVLTLGRVNPDRALAGRSIQEEGVQE